MLATTLVLQYFQKISKILLINLCLDGRAGYDDPIDMEDDQHLSQSFIQIDELFSGCFVVLHAFSTLPRILHFPMSGSSS